jgi:hypothetical protein
LASPQKITLNTYNIKGRKNKGGPICVPYFDKYGICVCVNRTYIEWLYIFKSEPSIWWLWDLMATRCAYIIIGISRILFFRGEIWIIYTKSPFSFFK